jgi:pimeloyl-ACP methyl ester carboxylesterase
MSAGFPPPGRDEEETGSESFPWIGGRMDFGAHEAQQNPEPRSARPAMLKESFLLTSEEGLPIHGDVWIGSGGRNMPCVVLCHGFQGFKDWAFFPHLAEALVIGGFAVVSFSTSRCGVSPGSDRFDRLDLLEQATISTDLGDLHVVLGALFDGTLPGSRLLDLAKVSLLGHSRGGAIALLMARRNPRIASLATWSAPARLLRAEARVVERWRREGRLSILSSWSGQAIHIGTAFLDDLDRHKYEPLEAVAGLPIPYLILHGRADDVVPPGEAEEIYEAGPTDGCEAIWIEGADHTFGAAHPFSGSNRGLDEAVGLSREFLNDTLY